MNSNQEYYVQGGNNEEEKQYYSNPNTFPVYDMTPGPSDTFPQPPLTQFVAADNSMVITNLENELPIQEEMDESAYNEYVSAQYYYPQEQYGHQDAHPWIAADVQQNIQQPPQADPLVYLNAPQTTNTRQPKFEEEDRSSFKKRNFCCCFRKRLHCISFFVSILLLLLLLLFLAFPFQFFSFDASDPFIPSSSSGLDIASANPISLSFMIGENITVASPSYFTWGVRQLTVNMQMKDAQGIIIPGFNGVGYQQNLRFPARSSRVLFTLPILLNYTSSSSATNFLTTDPAYLTLRKCNDPSVKLNFNLKVTLDISSISWTGFFPSVTLDLARKCPSGIGPLLSSLQSAVVQ